MAVGALRCLLGAVVCVPATAVFSPTPCKLEHKGCYVDPNPARLLRHGIPGCSGASPAPPVKLPAGEGPCDPAKMTPEYCVQACFAGMKATLDTTGGILLAGPENGNECFCDVVPEWDGKAWDHTRPLTPSKACSATCAGGKAGEDLDLPPGDNGCGGGWIIDVYALDCGSDWGWVFLLILGLGTAGYIGGFVGYNHKVRGLPIGPSALPHQDFWIEVWSLVTDGVSYAHARATAGNAYTKIQDDSSGQDDKGAKAGTSKPENTPETTGPADASTEKGNKSLGEVRDETVHSSQQKIQVVVNTATKSEGQAQGDPSESEDDELVE